MLYIYHEGNLYKTIIMLNNISNNMDAMLDALRPQEKEVFGLSGQVEILANKEAEQSFDEADKRSRGNDEYEQMVDNALAFGEEI